MNRIEQCVYNLVKSSPRIKFLMRDIYQLVCDLVPAKRTASVYEIKVREGFFYGFHDKCPWSGDSSMLLAHRITVPLRMPKSNDTLEVGYFSGPDYRNFKAVGATQAWNWHQGSMLQWVGSSSNIVFNDFDGYQLVARITDPNGTLIETLPSPIAALNPNGTKALSYNFPRLQRTPHKYGYVNGIDPECDSLIPSRHGIHLIDIASGRSDLLFSVADIVRIQSEPSMRGAFHYFSHCQFSPSGKRFIFFHRWMRGVGKIWTRMISCDSEDNDIHVFPTSGMVSHFGWRDDYHVLAYARTKKFGDGYYLFRDKTEEFSAVGRESFTSDGHPSFSRDRRWIVTDTYADRFRVRHLVLYDLENNKRYNLAKLYSPREANPTTDLRCDLHPRWNRNGTIICFDSTHTGERALCTVTLGDLTRIEDLSSL